MAVITGKAGTVSLGSVDGADAGGISIKAWTLNISREVIDISAFGDANFSYASNMGGQISATGTVTGTLTDGGSPFSGTFSASQGSEGDITLSADGADNYVFSAILSGGNVSVNRSGESTVSLSFASTGEITFP